MNMKKGLTALLMASAVTTMTGCYEGRCQEIYANNSKPISSSNFSDKNFDSWMNVANINQKEWVFAPIPEGYNVKVNDKVVGKDEYLPFVGFKRNEMTETIDPDTRTVVYGNEDSSVTVFLKDPTVKGITTTIQAKRAQMPDELTARLPEDKFAVDFLYINGFNKEIVTQAGKMYVPKRIAFGEDADQLVLIPEAKVVINNGRGNLEGGLIQYKADAYYLAQKGVLEAVPQPAQVAKPAKFSRKDFAPVKIDRAIPQPVAPANK